MIDIYDRTSSLSHTALEETVSIPVLGMYVPLISCNILTVYCSVVDDPTVKDVAKKLNKDPYSLLLSWGIQRGTGVLAKSVVPAHIKSNFQGRF